MSNYRYRYLQLSGKKGLATRKEIDAFVQKLIRDALRPTPPGGPSVVKTLACPKCNKPISIRVPVPVAHVVPASPAPVETPAPSGKLFDPEAAPKGLGDDPAFRAAVLAASEALATLAKVSGP